MHHVGQIFERPGLLHSEEPDRPSPEPAAPAAEDPPNQTSAKACPNR